MSVQDPKSRQFFQDLIGSRRSLRSTSNQSGPDSYGKRRPASRGATEVVEPIFQQSDFANLGDKVIICARGKYVLAEKAYFFK